MTSNRSGVPVSVNVIRAVGHRRGFIPPCRANTVQPNERINNENALQPKEEKPRFTFKRKKRDLSPAFRKIFKVLEERHENGSANDEVGVEEMDAEGDNDNKAAMADLCETRGGTELKASENSTLTRTNNSWVGETSKKSENKMTTPGVEVDNTEDIEVMMDSRGGGINRQQRELKNAPGPGSSKSSFVSYFQTARGVKQEVEAERLVEQRPSQCSQREPQPQTVQNDDKKYYNACYAKASMRKHKRFEDDGFIIVSGEANKTKIVLKDSSGETIESSNNFKITAEMLEDGKIFQLGGKEVQIGTPLQRKEFQACVGDCKMEVEDPGYVEENARGDTGRQRGPESVQGSMKPKPTFESFKRPNMTQGRAESAFNQDECHASQSVSQAQENCDKKYYEAVFAKASMRKHKRFEDDGFIEISGPNNKTKILLKDSSGETIEFSNNYKITTEMLEEGKVFQLGGKEIQIVQGLEGNPFGRNIGNGGSSSEIAGGAEIKSSNTSRKASDGGDSWRKSNSDFNVVASKEEFQADCESEMNVYDGFDRKRNHELKTYLENSKPSFSFKMPSSNKKQGGMDGTWEQRGSHYATQPQAPTKSVPEARDSCEKIEKRYYNAVYGKASTRKHKRFDNDGYIVVSGESSIALKNNSGKTIESSSNYKITAEMLEDGQVFKLGGKEIQILEQLKSNPFPDYRMPDYGPLGILGRNALNASQPTMKSDSFGTAKFEIAGESPFAVNVKPADFQPEDGDDEDVIDDFEDVPLPPPKKKMKGLSSVEDQMCQEDDVRSRFRNQCSPFSDSDEENGGELF